MDVTFAVPTSSVFALLGKNGSGKTTTLNCLLGLTPPSGGQLLVDGAPMRPAIFQRLASVPDSCALSDGLSVVELIATHEAAYLEHCRRYAADPALAA